MPTLHPHSSNAATTASTSTTSSDSSEYTILLYVLLGLVLYILVFYKLIRWGMAKSAKKTAENLAALESDLLAAYPDADERRRWLKEKRLECAYEGAWVGMNSALAEKKRTWLGERIEACEVEGEGMGEKGWQGV